MFCNHKSPGLRNLSSLPAWLVVLTGVQLCTSCQGSFSRDEPESSTKVPLSEQAETVSKISCLGRIEPKGGVVRVSAPYFEGRPSLVTELHVQEGDWVQEGEVIAYLNNKKPFEARVRAAEARIPIMRTRVEQVKEGPKEGDVAAQQAEIARQRSALELARQEHKRYARLYETEDVSASELDQTRKAVIDAEKMLEQAIEKLDSLTEIRESDIELAESELRAAIRDAEHARAELELSVVRSPIQARVMKIRAKEGEEVGPDGLVELARTDQMYVVAEVYETDISEIEVGKKATVTGEILPQQIRGTVETIGTHIDKGEVLPSDPMEFADRRIVKVDIRLDDSESVAGLIHGRVAVTFDP